MRLCLVFRRKNEIFFSIEKVFDTVVPVLRKSVEVHSFLLPSHTSGLLSVVKNLLAGRKVQADIYHVTGDVHYMVGCFKKASVLTIHDCGFLHNNSGIKGRFLKWLLLDMPVRRARMVTTISAMSKEEIVRNSGCDPQKVVVIPNPIGQHFYFVPRVFNKTQPHILFIGSTANKNLVRVIEALKGISCWLLIIGEVTGELLSRLEASAITYERRSKLSEEQLAAAYASADIVLFPSLYEGFGLPVIEAQKCGRVVVTSNISPMKEVAGGGACLVDPLNVGSIREGIEKVIKNDEYRNQLVETGFENVKRFSPTVIAEQYLHVYKKVISFI